MTFPHDTRGNRPVRITCTDTMPWSYDLLAFFPGIQIFSFFLPLYLSPQPLINLSSTSHHSKSLNSMISTLDFFPPVCLQCPRPSLLQPAACAISKCDAAFDSPHSNHPGCDRWKITGALTGEFVKIFAQIQDCLIGKSRSPWVPQATEANKNAISYFRAPSTFLSPDDLIPSLNAANNNLVDFA